MATKTVEDWKNYTGSALILEGTDKAYFLKKCAQQAGESEEKLCDFISAGHPGGTMRFSKLIGWAKISPEFCTEVTFSPYKAAMDSFSNGGVIEGYDYSDKELLAVFSGVDADIFTVLTDGGEIYNLMRDSYETILGKYLPEGFELDKSIGLISYYTNAKDRRLELARLEKEKYWAYER